MNNELVEYNNNQLTKHKNTDHNLDLIMKNNLYPNAHTIYDIAKKNNDNITLQQVQNYIKSQVPYQLTKERHLKKSDMGFMIAYYPFQIVQIDLLDLSRFSYDYSQFKDKKKMEDVKTDFNKGYKYLLIFIDLFSRWTDVVMLKSKNIEDCLHALKIILEFNNISPKVIMSDSESSFLSEQFQDFFSEHNIKHDVIVLNNHRALSVLDRFCRTLRSRLTKLFLGTGSTSWVNDISTIIYQYNNTKHRGILNYTPQEVLSDPKAQEQILELNHEKASKNQQLRTKSTIKAGDKVRLFIENKFSKGSDPSYTSKVYTVKSKSGKNILLDNGKRYVDQNLLKIDDSQYLDNNLLLENDKDDSENENIFTETKKQNKINKKLKKEDLIRPTHEELQAPREKRNVSKIDYKKLNSGR